MISVTIKFIMLTVFMLMYKKTTCQFKLKLISNKIFSDLPNNTTIYKHNYFKLKHIYKHLCY
jgi:hypothetical protein